MIGAHYSCSVLSGSFLTLMKTLVLASGLLMLVGSYLRCVMLAKYAAAAFFFPLNQE